MTRDNLPARQPGRDDPRGPTGIPLSATPTEALCFALGYIAASPVSAEQYGGVTALVEEIMRRSVPIDPSRPGDPDRDGSIWNLLIRHMPPQLAAAIQTLYMAHRGQRWARSGRQSPPPPAAIRNVLAEANRQDIEPDTDR